MSKSTAALEVYTAAQNKREALIAANKAVFDEYNRIGMEIIDADNALQDAVAEEKPTEPIKNSKWEAKYVPRSQTYADIDAVEALCQGGIITQAKRNEIIKTVDLSAKVTIRPVPQI